MDDELKRILENTRVAYDRAGKEYCKLFGNELDSHPEDRELLKAFSDSLPPSVPVCDLGCGPAAQYGAFLARFRDHVYGVDLSPGNVALARDAYPEIVFRCENMLQTTFSDGFFGGLISFYALFHIPKNRDRLFFREAARLLQDGGKLLLMTHKGDLVKTFREIWKEKDLSLFANFHTEDELTASAEAEGLIVESCRSARSYYEFPEERIILLARKA